MKTKEIVEAYRQARKNLTLEEPTYECQEFVALVDFALNYLKRDFDEDSYEMFYLKSLEGKTSIFLARKFNYSISSVNRKVKLVKEAFEDFINSYELTESRGKKGESKTNH